MKDLLYSRQKSSNKQTNKHIKASHLYHNRKTYVVAAKMMMTKDYEAKPFSYLKFTVREHGNRLYSSSCVNMPLKPLPHVQVKESAAEY